MAIVAPGRPHAEYSGLGESGPSSALGRLLGDAAQITPDRPAFRDSAGREEWAGRPSFELTAEVGTEAVARLSAYLAGLGLEPGARLGICLPNGSEAAMSILAAGDAGLTPCLLDVTADAGELSNAIEAADIRAIITQTRFGPERLAEKLCFVAAGFFRLRFLLAFGPEVPDGVVDLDPILLEPRRERQPVRSVSQEPGLVSFSRDSSGKLAYFRSYRSLIAAAAPIVRAARLRPGERLLTLLAPDDLKGLATGLAAGLVAGATVEFLAVFDAAAFGATLLRPEPTHLVAPGWMEPALARMDLPSTLRSVILVHEAPLALDGRQSPTCSVVDVVCCAELALIPSARLDRNQISLPELCNAGPDAPDAALLQLRVDSDDQILLRGPALAWPDHVKPDEFEWQQAGLHIERIGGRPVGIA